MINQKVKIVMIEIVITEKSFNDKFLSVFFFLFHLFEIKIIILNYHEILTLNFIFFYNSFCT